jgi:flagellar basal body rod protein FlgG
VAAVTQRNLAPSAYETTGNPLDAALATDAFFVVQTAQGIAYTRAGAFAVSPTGLLVTGSGNPVLATNGAPIRLPVDAAVAIDATGAVSANGQSVATLQQVRLTGTITALGGSLYTGTAIPVVGGLVVPGALNTSNVALTQTLAALTRAQALYGANASAWHVAMQIRQQGDQLAQLP